jgi:hypothetical protein
MQHVYQFFIENLEFFYASLQRAGGGDGANEELSQLANTCLNSFQCFIDWFSFELLFSKQFLLINVTLTFLNHEKLSINSAKCLITLINRKGSNEERKPLLGMFDQSILTQIMTCISANLKNKDLTKYLIQILIGMGFHLSTLWTSTSFEKPAHLSQFLEAIFELTFSPNKHFSFDAIQLWNNFLTNEFIQMDQSIFEFLSHFSLMITQSTLLFKHSDAEFQEDFDSEEDYLKFVHKYRAELSKLIKLGASLRCFEPFIENAHKWAVDIFTETNELLSQDSGYDASCLLYLKWDALLFLWTSLMQQANKQMKVNSSGVASFKNEREPHLMKETTLAMLSMSVGSKFTNPNYASFSYSLLSSVITFSEFYDEDVKLNIYAKVLEKFFADLTFFKSDCAADQADKSRVSSAANLKCKFNVRRQIAAMTLNLCRNYAGYFKGIFDSILSKVFEIVSCVYSSQMEKVILTQAIVLASSQIYSNEMQSRLITQLLAPIFEFFSSQEFRQAVSNPEFFIAFVGLNESATTIDTNQDSIVIRKKIFYLTNLYYGILKCIGNLDHQETHVHSGVAGYATPLHATTTTTTTMGFNLECFEGLVSLLKCFNIVHSNELRQKVNASLLAMTDAAKATSLGKEGACSNSITTNASADSEPDKAIMFFHNTYDSLNQLIGLFLMKYKNEFLFSTLNQAHMELISRLGEATFACFSEIPNFRVRSLVRYLLKSCLLNKVERQAFEKQFCVVKTNEMLLEYFFPNIFARISQTNLLNENAKVNTNEQSNQNDANLENQLIEENQFTLMCREVCELFKTFLFPPLTITPKSDIQSSSNQQQQQQQQQPTDYLANMDENLTLEEVKSDSKDDSKDVLSELAIVLLKNNKQIYQSTLLFLFEGLTWPDSYCCIRFVRMAMTLFEKFPISYANGEPYANYAAADTAQFAFVISLNPQITEHLFRCCLSALQIHGEHPELASLIMNLGFLLYEKSPSQIQEQLNANFAQIPNLNKKLFDEYLFKIQSGNSNKENKSGRNEKLKKDCNLLFKKILQPIVGKSVGQLYKNEIKIKNLQPLNILKRSTASSDDQANVEGIFNICSLFDPNL